MVILFADGVKAAGTTVPRAVAAAIRHFDRWQGVTGAYTFTRRGDIVADRAYLSVVKNGRFVPLESEPKEPIKGE
jgi:ABC-type branched-subunit amino acid transport system substrate-binding protein